MFNFIDEDRRKSFEDLQNYKKAYDLLVDGWGMSKNMLTYLLENDQIYLSEYTFCASLSLCNKGTWVPFEIWIKGFEGRWSERTEHVMKIYYEAAQENFEMAKQLCCSYLDFYPKLKEWNKNE